MHIPGAVDVFHLKQPAHEPTEGVIAYAEVILGREPFADELEACREFPHYAGNTASEVGHIPLIDMTHDDARYPRVAFAVLQQSRFT